MSPERAIDHAPRAIALAGADNVRDLGGLPAADGRLTATGRLYRGMFTPSLTDDDLRLLRDDVGLRLVVDLRSRGEVKRAPGALRMPGLTWRHHPLPVAGGVAMPQTAEDHVRLYLGFIAEDPGALAAALDELMDADAQPALFHCAMGKDRTGVVAAMLLDVLGVPRAVIHEDFALTDAHIEAMDRRLGAVDVYRLAPGQRRGPTDPGALDAILDALDDGHGGTAGWLAAHGVAPARIDAFRAAMLAPARG